MAFRRVTIKDVADALGLSRNTVSKIFNNRGNVQESTRLAVLKKAQELGYFQLVGDELPQSVDSRQHIALFTCRAGTDNHFVTQFMPSFASHLSRGGNTLMMYDLREDELRQKRLPVGFNPEHTAGIAVIELFDRDYINMLCALKLPTIIVDGYQGAFLSDMICDRVSVENVSGTIALVNHVIAKGADRIGFIGNPEHCSSFSERWYGFCRGLSDANISPNRNLCIIDRDSSCYDDPVWITNRLRQLSPLPDALICVNDHIAIRAMSALKQMGLSIPKDIMVTGFGGTMESVIVEPSLTTVQIPSSEIAQIVANSLLNLMNSPDRPAYTLYVQTKPIFRESTNRL